MIDFIIFNLSYLSSSGKALGNGLDGPGSIPGGGRGGDFASLLCVQIGPGVHSASYKMSTRVKAIERRINRRTSS